MQRPEAQLKSLLDDVLHRQVDTIVAHAIIGTSAEEPLQALVDIANAYIGFLHAIDRPLDSATVDQDVFERLCTHAAALLSEDALSAEDRAIVARIKQRSKVLAKIAAEVVAEHEEQLQGKDLLADANSLVDAVDVHTSQRASINSTWELGVATVALQSVVSLDGDIVTRVAENYSGPQYEYLHNLHDRSVNLSLHTWEGLVRSIGSVFKALIPGGTD